MDLPTAPDRPIAQDGPAFGTYRGTCGATALDGLAVGRLRRFVREKAWQWFCAVDDRLAVGGAVVDAGPAGTAFAWVLDRRASRLVVDESRVLPPFTASTDHGPDGPSIGAFFRDANLRIEPARVDGGVATDVRGRIGPVEVDLTFARDDAVPMTAVCPVDGGDHPGINVTHKETGLSASGTAATPDLTHEFDRADGMVDATHGVLARETAWRWAIASGRAVDGTQVGTNLVAGFNDGLENAAWVDGEPRSVGAASFEFDREDPSGNWRVSTEDGAVDLEMDPQAVRSEDLDLGLVVSRYAQPVGVWRGTVAGRTVALPGVAETHYAKW